MVEFPYREAVALLVARHGPPEAMRVVARIAEALALAGDSAGAVTWTRIAAAVADHQTTAAFGLNADLSGVELPDVRSA
jgi:hypothetical protein